MRVAVTVLLIWLLASASSSAAGIPKPAWILIDTVAHRLDVYRNGEAVARFRNIAIGSGGTTTLRRAGEETTPLGEFRISRINRSSRFHIFLGLDYPTLAYADRALAAGILGHGDYQDFLDRYARTGSPPQNTVLGGYIGIHGLGEADPTIHARVNWTNGCIALTNDQIEQLTRLVRVGTRVFIR